MSAPTQPGRAAKFAERAASVGTVVHETTRAHACELVLGLLSAERARKIALDTDTSAGLPALVLALRDAALHLTPRDADAQALATADAGISWAAFGVAETGSVALAARAAQDRLVSMLPPLHLVLLPDSSLLPDLEAAAERLRAWTVDGVQQPYVSLVTGASRTSDIERVLTIGVHGPRAHHVVLLSDE